MTQLTEVIALVAAIGSLVLLALRLGVFFTGVPTHDLRSHLKSKYSGMYSEFSISLMIIPACIVGGLIIQAIDNYMDPWNRGWVEYLEAFVLSFLLGIIFFAARMSGVVKGAREGLRKQIGEP